MSNKEISKPMRDVFISELYTKMEKDTTIFFLSADFGSPALDKLRSTFPDRFINVGIAEQNLINVSCGLALEGFSVFAYAIAPFITMRCFEQIRVNLAILSQIRPMNVNIIGVGAGFSYEVSGPTHHCLEDISIMRTLPNFEVLSPSDWYLTTQLVDYSLQNKIPKYLRFDAKPLKGIYDSISSEEIRNGFSELKKGKDILIISTGYMTQKALSIVLSSDKNLGLVDLIKLKGYSEAALLEKIKEYNKIITIEEGFIGKGGVDSLVNNLVVKYELHKKVINMGLQDNYIFHIGSREHLHGKHKVDEKAIKEVIDKI